MLCTSFYAWHIGLFDVVVRKQHFDAFAELGREAHVCALITAYFPGLARVEVRLTSFALDHFARFADADALGNGFVGFHGHIFFLLGVENVGGSVREQGGNVNPERYDARARTIKSLPSWFLSGCSTLIG